MQTDPAAVLYGLASALTWGAGDFGGGVASRHTNVATVVLISQFCGALVLLAAALALGHPVPDAVRLCWGALAGLGGALGVLALYTGLSRGSMGIVAPLSAVLAAMLPTLTALAREGVPGPQRLVGCVLALAAIWLLSAAGGPSGRGGNKGIGYAFAAGAGFALFFIGIDAAGREGFLWSLLAARAASVSGLLAYALGRRLLVRPERGRVRLIMLCGVCDTLGNVFFALAAARGRLDLAALVSSFYPAATVVLACVVLRERFAPRQWAGVAAALAALPLVAA